MKITYKDGYAYVDGYKFRKDSKTGYYLSSKKIDGRRPRLHVYVWEKHFGKIPKGYQIHHKDEDKDNNEIDNLMCMTQKEHLRWHGENIPSDRLKKWQKNMEVQREKTKAWHSSPEGRAWHKKHAEKIGMAHIGKTSMVCENCGKKFISGKKHGKYCSANCRSKARRKSGIDNETRICVICGKAYSVNKYSKTKTCSKECSSKLLSIRKRNK